MEKKDKEAYKLWWSFLKLSDNYKKYCMNPPPQPRAGKYTVTLPFLWDPELSKFYFKTKHNFDVKRGIFPESLFRTYRAFGDVHAVSFEFYWKHFEEFLKKNPPKKKKQPVREFEGKFMLWSFFYEMACKEGEKEPNFEEFKEYIFTCLKNKEERYLSIDLKFPIGEINNSIKHFVNKDVKKKLKDEMTNIQWRKCYYNCFPTPNLRVDEVNRYLKVLKVFKSGLKGKSAFKELNPNGDYDDPDQRTAFYSDKRKAERILKNVEKGYFPGIYEKKSKK